MGSSPLLSQPATISRRSHLLSWGYVVFSGYEIFVASISLNALAPSPFRPTPANSNDPIFQALNLISGF